MGAKNEEWCSQSDNRWKSVNLQLLDSYINTVKPTITNVAPREVKCHKADPTIPTLPSPSNRIQYTKVEVMDILSINSKLQWPITMADIIADPHNKIGRTFGKDYVNQLMMKHCNKKTFIIKI